MVVSSSVLMGSLAMTGGAGAAQKPTASTALVMVPLIAVSRETSPDRSFVTKASQMAIATLSASRQEIAEARVSVVQDTAVRSFNSAAEAYNSLADIASQRGFTVAQPSSIFTQDRTPSLVDGATVGPADVAYMDNRRGQLLKTISIYRDEVRTGKDPLVVAFAARMQARLEKDLTEESIDVEHLDRGNRYGDRGPNAPEDSAIQ